MMTWIDWLIVAVSLAGTIGMASLGAISFVAMFDYTAGLTANWWALILTPVMLLLSLSDWRIGIILVIAVSTTVWFMIGGVRVMTHLSCRLASLKRDEQDDGTVLPSECDLP